MPYPKTYSGTLTTDASGDGTLTLPADASDGNINGLLVEIRFTPDGSSPYSDGFDYTVVGVDSGRTYFVEDVADTSAYGGYRQPTTATHDPSDGSETTTLGIPVVVNERLIITVADGGDTKIGTWEVVIT